MLWESNGFRTNIKTPTLKAQKMQSPPRKLQQGLCSKIADISFHIAVYFSLSLSKVDDIFACFSINLISIIVACRVLFYSLNLIMRRKYFRKVIYLLSVCVVFWKESEFTSVSYQTLSIWFIHKLIEKSIRFLYKFMDLSFTTYVLLVMCYQRSYQVVVCLINMRRRLTIFTPYLFSHTLVKIIYYQCITKDK